MSHRLRCIVLGFILLMTACTVGTDRTRAEAEANLREFEASIESVLVAAYGDAAISSWTTSVSSGGCVISRGRSLFSEMTLNGIFEAADAHKAFVEAVGEGTDFSGLLVEDGVDRWQYRGLSEQQPAAGGVRIEDGVLTISVSGQCFVDS